MNNLFSEKRQNMKRPFMFLCFLFSLLILSDEKELNIPIFYYIYLYSLSVLHIQRIITSKVHRLQRLNWILYLFHIPIIIRGEPWYWNVFPTCCESAARVESPEPKVSFVEITGFTQDCFVWIPNWMSFRFFHIELRKNYCMKMEEKTKGFLQQKNPKDSFITNMRSLSCWLAEDKFFVQCTSAAGRYKRVPMCFISNLWQHSQWQEIF